MARFFNLGRAWRLLLPALPMALILSATAVEARYRGTQSVCVTGVAPHDRLNVRSRPGTRSRKVGSFASHQCGMNVEAVEGNWTYLRGSARGRNLQGWVNNRFLRRASPGDFGHGGGSGQDGGGIRDAGFPVRAATGGGIVRSGPGTSFRRVTSLPEFAPITVLGNANVMFNGYPWFRIRYRGGRTGFMWGGIICSTKRPFAGTFDTCANFRRSLSGHRPVAPQPPRGGRRTVHLSCNEGIPMVVTFFDTRRESYALYTHDSGPKIRVTARPSGSGFRYTDGFHELRGKGGTIDLIEGGRLLDRCFAD